MMGNCPLCGASITSVADEQGCLRCQLCGAHLKAKAPPAVPPAPTLAPPAGWEAIRAELQGLLAGQQQMLAKLTETLTILKTGPSPPAPRAAAPLEGQSPGPSAEVQPPSARPSTRGRRKTVLLVDDDPDTREAAAAALRRAQIPVRPVGDGKGALAAITAEKPDVIVLELDFGGAMSGRDVVNMIKATIEWVDIPIVLYTRAPIASETEARQIHGGDSYVPKGPGSPDTLVAHVIEAFQRG